MAYVQEEKNSAVKKLRKTTKGKGRHFLTAKEGAGMTEAGRKAYKKEITELNKIKKLAKNKKRFKNVSNDNI